MDIPLRPHEDFPTQVILRCLYGALASRPDIEVLHLPIRVTDPKTQLARHSNGVLYLRDETPENSVARDVLARFGATLLFTLLRRCDFKPNVEAEVYSRALVLENFTEDTYIELPPSPSPYFAVRGYNDDQVPLQHSVRGERTFWNLRDGDTIDFRKVDIKVEISFSSPTHLSPSPSVPVTRSTSTSTSATLSLSPTISVAFSPSISITVSPSSGDSNDMPSRGRKIKPSNVTDGDEDVKTVSTVDADPETESEGDLDPPSLGKAESPQQRSVSRKPDYEDFTLFQDATRKGIKTYSKKDRNLRKHSSPASSQLKSEDVTKEAAARSMLNNSAREHISGASDHVAEAEAEVDTTAYPPSSGKLRTPSRRAKRKSADPVDAHEADGSDQQLPEKKRSRQSTELGSDDKDHTSLGQSDSEIAVAPSSVKKNLGTMVATPSTVKMPSYALLSSSKLKPHDKAFMTKSNIKVADETPSKSTNYVCVVRDESIPSTIKVLKALVAGKMVVSDKWITDSKKEKVLKNPVEYIHEDLDTSVDLNMRKKLFSGKRLLFTEQAVITWGNDWSQIEEIIKAAGAMEVLRVSAFEAAAGEEAILLGVDNDVDKDAIELIKSGRTVYNRKIIGQSIIRGSLELEDVGSELKLPLGGATEGKKKSKK